MVAVVAVVVAVVLTGVEVGEMQEQQQQRPLHSRVCGHNSVQGLAVPERQ